MSRWNRLIKIGPTLYLTDTGLVGGDRIITDVTNLDKLRPAKVGQIRLAIDGTPKKFRQDNTGAGTLISIAMARMPDAASGMLDDIIAENDAAEAGSSLVRIVFAGANDDITVDCEVGHPGGIEGVEYPGGFIEDLKIDAKLNYTVSAIVTP